MDVCNPNRSRGDRFQYFHLPSYQTTHGKSGDAAGAGIGGSCGCFGEQKSKFEQAARGVEENARRKALEEFLADLHVEERHYAREHRVLFAHRKSLILQERIFFRNIPISNWVEHEVPVEEGADLDLLAKTLSVFNNALDGGNAASRSVRRLSLRAS